MTVSRNIEVKNTPTSDKKMFFCTGCKASKEETEYDTLLNGKRYMLCKRCTDCRRSRPERKARKKRENRKGCKHTVYCKSCRDFLDREHFVSDSKTGILHESCDGCRRRKEKAERMNEFMKGCDGTINTVVTDMEGGNKEVMKNENVVYDVEGCTMYVPRHKLLSFTVSDDRYIIKLKKSDV